MSSAHEALERSEHAAHAAHGGGHGKDRFGMFLGVTMAILGVLLALCSALLGSERTELIHKLVEEEHAHAKYQAQDVKHRAAFLALSQMHAVATGSNPESVNKTDALSMAKTVERYLSESALAKTWTTSYEPVTKLHMEAQESYEHALLAAEIGIVIASIAMMMKNRGVWILSIALGVASMGIAAKTYRGITHEVHEADAKVDLARDAYEKARASNKTTKEEALVVDEMKKWAGAPTADMAKASESAKASDSDPKKEDKAAPTAEKPEAKKSDSAPDKEAKPADKPAH